MQFRVPNILYMGILAPTIWTIPSRLEWGGRMEREGSGNKSTHFTGETSFRLGTLLCGNLTSFWRCIKHVVQGPYLLQATGIAYLGRD